MRHDGDIHAAAGALAQPAASPLRPLRALVAIACHGTRNLPLLRRVMAGWQAMPMQVDIVVLSDAPKPELAGPGVRVQVGLPARNPWSLPFAHKPLFVEQAANYDLFAYSEDDMALTQRHVEAFLRLAEVLPANEVPGFLRYEVDPAGRCWLPEMHGCHHWDPHSVRRRGSHVVAEYSNEHAAFYLLTRRQLQRAIASGGFDRAPCEGRYDMLCTAATDPYTQCGLHKVVSLTAIDDFLIHHLSDRYAGRLGLPRAALDAQVRTLLDIGQGRHPASRLLGADTLLERGEWAPRYDIARPDPAVLAAVPADARSVLSLGCGTGVTEAALMARGAQVTALPLDSVVGAMAAARGIEVLYGTLRAGLAQLRGRRFDAVVVDRLLHRVAHPQRLAAACALHVAPGGRLVVVGPNFGTLRLSARRLLGRGETRRLRSHAAGGISVVQPAPLRAMLQPLGLQTQSVHWVDAAASAPARALPARWTAAHWVVQAVRPA